MVVQLFGQWDESRVHRVIVDWAVHSMIIQKNLMPGTRANSCNSMILNCPLTVNYKSLQSSET